MKATPRIVWVAVAVLLLVGLVIAAQASAAVPTPQDEKPQPPVASLKIVPIPGNIKDANTITGTVKYITDTAVGEKQATVALFTSGLSNVPISVPVKMSVAATDPKAQVTKATWALTTPPGSKAAITGTVPMTLAWFVPDVAGVYKVDVALTNDAGEGPSDSIQMHAGMYVGESKGNCKQCHPRIDEEWAKTGHARILSDEIDNLRTPDVPTHYAETCVRCHTTGYYPGAANGGFADAAAKANYKLPTFEAINAAGKGGASNFAAMPPEVKNMANIQCETCHGPASEHLKGEKAMAASFDEGVCNQCHNGGGHHLKGTDLKNAAHADASATAWNYPVGPAEQDCVRCHTGRGYASFLANPKNKAEWDNSAQTLTCTGCHDPHSDANTFQLRVIGKPIEITFDAKDAGLSATCEECHNARTKPADALKSSFPHYSSVAEFLNDTGGVDYGQKLPNSPHGMMVGAAPVPNPAAAEDPEAAKFLFTTAGKEGNKPGPCVTCHMYPTIEDAKDPNYHKVGSHSFNTVSPDGKFDYTAACKTCHTDIKDDFNLPAKADYDGNGKTEGVQDEVKGLLGVLWKGLADAGLKKIETGYPYASLPKDAPDKVKNAWYNFRTVYGVMWGAEGAGNEGKAQAIHNFKRSVGLLQASYKDLTGQDVPGATIMK